MGRSRSECEAERIGNLVFRRRNDALYYEEFAASTLEWLRGIRDRCGYFVVGDMANFLYCERFGNKRDREIALYLSLLIKGDSPDKQLAQISAMADIVGDSPFMWVSEKRYIELSVPWKREERLPYSNVTYGDIYLLATYLYQCIRDYGCVRNALVGLDKAPCVSEYVTADVSPYVRHTRAEYIRYKVQQMLLFMCKGRVGYGIWDDVDYDEYPESTESRAFVKAYTLGGEMPVQKRVDTMRMGGRQECYFAFLAYREASKGNPVGYLSYQRRFHDALMRRNSRSDYTYKLLRKLRRSL